MRRTNNIGEYRKILSLSDAAVERLSSVMSNVVALLGESVEVKEIFLSQSVDKNQ